MLSLVFLALTTLLPVSQCQQSSPQIPNSFPHDYPGKPQGDFNPQWQNYYEVHDLPNVTFPLPRNWAGSIPVNRVNHPNDTLFFWAFERENGSLSSAANERSSEPWGIWLNGGPGASSLLGLMLENGPIHVLENGTIVGNPWSWDKLVDYVFVDQPVGTGYSTADAKGYIVDEDQMAEDFLGFLSNLVKVFPSLANRPLFLTGESYAGTYIPYITKALFSTSSPPVKLSKIAIGNGAMGAFLEFEELPMLSVIETYPQLISYDPEVFNYFKEQSHLCGYDLNLTYPQTVPFAPINNTFDFSGSVSFSGPLKFINRKKTLASMLFDENIADESNIVIRAGLNRRAMEKREERRQAWKRDLSGRANGTIDPFYGCFLLDEVTDYAQNFSFPWNLTTPTSNQNLDVFAPYNPYDVPDARNPAPNLDPTTFLNDPRTRAALHAPTSKNWTLQISYPFNSSFNTTGPTNPFGDPSLEPVAFFSELATNATANNVAVIIYSGNDDSVVGHLSSEIVIQNTTFGGIRGFTRKPATPFTDDSGNFIGIIHQERNWTFAIVDHAGHEVPEYAPEAAFVFFREFILGSNQTGLVTNTSQGISVVGGEGAPLSNGILPGTPGILYGSGTDLSTAFYPSATVAAWDAFIASAAPGASESGGSKSNSGARGDTPSLACAYAGIVLPLGLFLGALSVW